MEEPVGDVVPRDPVPESHDQHVNNVGHIGRGPRTLEHPVLHEPEDQPHIDEVPEPEGQGNVPPIPEVLDVR